ncbi:MAG: hypothetical protein DRN29_06095 [Thermoplasmata archaeon]|nr:MAG: hypothetical protein DRN29_06095 [Thermoplasmata archaeon]
MLCVTGKRDSKSKPAISTGINLIGNICERDLYFFSLYLGKMKSFCWTQIALEFIIRATSR